MVTLMRRTGKKCQLSARGYRRTCRIFGPDVRQTQLPSRVVQTDLINVCRPDLSSTPCVSSTASRRLAPLPLSNVTLLSIPWKLQQALCRFSV